MEKRGKIKKLYFRRFLYLITTLVFFVFSFPAFAATIFVSPSSKTCYVGETCSVDISVSSIEEAMNAISGSLDFPQSLLSVASLSKENSILSLWIQEPSFSANSVEFEGIILNPGFTGSSGKIVEVEFNPLSVGVAELSFSSGSVLANDGNGTSILENLQTGTLNILLPIDEPEEEEDEEGDNDEEDSGGDDEENGQTNPEGDGDEAGSNTGGTTNKLPGLPKISSSTHPDSNSWYSKTTASFSWKITEEIQEVRLSVSSDSEEVPTVNYSAIDSKEFSGIADGVWYLHVQFKNKNGWGEVSHFLFRIDTQKPDYFKIERIISSSANADSYNEFLIEADDKMSGVDHCVISVDNQDSNVWYDDGTHIFKISKLSPGEHNINVSVVDKANNSFFYLEKVYIDPLDNSSVTQFLNLETEEKGDEEDTGIWEIGAPIIKSVTPVISYAGLGIGLGQALLFTGSAKSIFDIWLIILRLISFLSSFFRRRKGQPWGIVYDSVTKQPLDPAYVSINSTDRKDENMAITDLEGRYGFLVPRGNYVIKANKTHYVFPSEKLKGRLKDELYDNLYFGESVSINNVNEDFVHYNIPLDPVGFDWNEYAKRERGLVKVDSRRKSIIMFLSNLVFFVGFSLSAYLLLAHPNLINFGIFAFYAVILVFQEFWKTSHPITKLLEVGSNNPISFAIIKAYVDGNDILLKTIVTDENGRFYILTPPGKYYLTVETKQEDGSYSSPYRTVPVNLTKGIVLKNLYIKRNNSN